LPETAAFRYYRPLSSLLALLDVLTAAAATMIRQDGSVAHVGSVTSLLSSEADRTCNTGVQPELQARGTSGFSGGDQDYRSHQQFLPTKRVANVFESPWASDCAVGLASRIRGKGSGSLIRGGRVRLTKIADVSACSQRALKAKHVHRQLSEGIGMRLRTDLRSDLCSQLLNAGHAVICLSALAISTPAIAVTDSAGGDAGSGSSPAASAVQASSRDNQLQEVVVTAEKRSERIQDVPIPVSTIDTGVLAENSQVKLTDYYSQVPGLNVAPSTVSTQTLSIRGITTGAAGTGPPAAGPTVGITVDDVPFGGTAGGDTYVPDFDPGDLARIEVLRGPQGTLYGASSMGGLLKFVTVDPSTAGFSGRVEAGTSTVYNGAELGYNFRGSVNIPLSDTFAVRASAYTRQDPGYVDNPVLGIDGINEDHASGGHLAALWRPSDSFSLKLSAFYQTIKGDGTNSVTPNPPSVYGVPAVLGDLQQYFVPGVGPYDRTAQAYSALLTYKIGTVTLTALSGYNSYKVQDSYDFTYYLGSLSQSVFGQLDTPLFNNVKISRFTQEVRLQTPIGTSFDWLLGGFYSREDETFVQHILITDPQSDATVGQWGAFFVPGVYTEYAAFTDLTYHVTDRFDVQVGGRESFFDIANGPATDYGPYYTLVFGAPSEVMNFPEETLRQNAFTYLLTPRFKITPDWMAYARITSGYRAGGNNFSTPGVPASYGDDKTRDYEIGAKGDLLANSLSIDASIYYIDWKNMQLSLAEPNGFSYTGNASAAKSQGVELSVQARPTAGLNVAGWIALSDAVLTQSIPGAGENGVVYGFSGDRLPYTARWTGNISADQQFPLTGRISGSVGGSLSYVGAREDIFLSSPGTRQYLPPYAKTDLRAGLTSDPWKVNLYVNNVADRRGLIAGGAGNVLPYTFYYIQPRTVGLSVSRTF
jgi:iron complex outermembrane receptor protein